MNTSREPPSGRLSACVHSWSMHSPFLLYFTALQSVSRCCCAKMYWPIDLFNGGLSCVCMVSSHVYRREEAKGYMRKHQRVWQHFQEHRVASIVAGHISVVAVLGLLMLGMHILGAFAHAPCASGDHTYIVVSGD